MPPVSQLQRRAMHAALRGESTLGIPKSVASDSVSSDPGGKLPKKAKPKKSKYAPVRYKKDRQSDYR